MKGWILLLLIAQGCSVPVIFESVKQVKVYDLNALASTLGSSLEISTKVNGNDFYWSPSGDNTRSSSATIVQMTPKSEIYPIGDTDTIKFSDSSNGNGIQITYSTYRNCGPALTTANVLVSCDPTYVTPEFSLTGHDDQYCNVSFTMKSSCSWVTILDNTCFSSNPNACGASSNRGECLVVQDTDTSGFCDCYSGYGGSKCSFDPLPIFAPATVHPQSLDLQAEFDYELTHQVTFTVILPSEKGPGLDSSMNARTTTIRFSGETPDCDYPNSIQWIHNNNGTADFYTASFSYSDMSRCGLTDAGIDSSGNFHVFTNSLAAKRTYELKDGLFTLRRTVGPTYAFTFLFPKRVSVKMSIDAMDNYITQFSAVSGSSFDGSTNNWNFAFSGLIKAPYELSLAGVIASGEGQSRVGNAGSLSTCPASTGPTDFCSQIFSITADDCSPLRFRTQANFTVICRPGLMCVDAATPWFVATFDISTANSCPIDKEIAISDISVASYNDSDLTNGATLFGQSKPIYFAVTFGTIAQVSITAVDRVCVSVSQQTGGCASGLIAFTLNTPSDGLSSHTLNGSPVWASFTVHGNDVNDIIPLNKNDISTIYIQADIVVTYDGFRTYKRNVQFNAARYTFQMKGEEEKMANQFFSSSSQDVAFSVFFLFTLFVVIL